MGIFDYFKKPEPVAPKVFKRTYAAANQSLLFNDFKASERSADSELQPVLKTIRARARDLARNNEYAKRYLNLLKTNVVGERGFGLQVKSLDSTGKLDQVGNQSIEDAFRAWGKLSYPTADGKMSWIDAQKLCIETLARDGEVFIIKHRSAKFKNSFAIEFIEADQVDESLSQKAANGNDIRMGIELDNFRRPVAYHVLGYHPGDYDYTTKSITPKHIRIPAERVIHVFIPLRAGQTRGESWMSPAMAGMKQLGGYREAAIVAARVGASKTGFFTSPAGDGFAADDLDNNIPIMDAQPGSFHQLPAGVSFQSFDPAYPSNEFESFHKSVLRGVASGLGISYTSLSNDLEATSYSSIRQGALEERDHYKNLQAFMVEHFIRPVYEEWLASAMEIGSINLPLRVYEKFALASEFRGKAWSWVDPQKEMTAAVMGMKNGILSIQDVASQYGKDVEELFSQIQRDKALAEQFGIKYALEPFAAQMVAIPPDVIGDSSVD